MRRGDFVINSRSDRKGSAGVADRDGSVSLISSVLVPQERVFPPFVHHLLRSVPFQEEYYRNGKGIVADLWSTNYSDMKNITLGVPPIEEQGAIAAFLDRETAQIDALVAEQQRLMELLKEKRQAVISHAVTKGLNPDAPMKPSGVEWLEEVPAHWEVMALKRVVQMQSGEAITGEEIEEIGKYPVFGGNGIRGFSREYTHDGEFVLIGRQGALCGNINYGAGRFWASEHAVVATPLVPVATRWLGEMMRAMNLNQYSVSAAQPGLSVDLIGRVMVPLPPLPEQELISFTLDEELSKAETMAIEVELAIDLLRERRAALISAAVTGRIDVRHLVAAEAA